MTIYPTIKFNKTTITFDITNGYGYV